MDDPWDVKSVRHAGQYTSCMKLNGSPLLPPVLSKECRKEMQYYKLLAKEVEKRISILQPYVDSDKESNEDKTDVQQLPEQEQNYGLAKDNVQACFDPNLDSITALPYKQTNDNPELPTSDFYHLSSNPNIVSATEASKFIIDFSLSINQTSRNVVKNAKSMSPCPCLPIDLPERDYNCVKHKQLILDVETNTRKREKIDKDLVNFNFSVDRYEMLDPYLESLPGQDGASSISSKTFTGSLNDLHTESVKETHRASNLVRQRSYTLLNPSPHLLAHLEVQSLNTGVEMSCISMSESLSNLSTPNKKRRSWDLESAKVKWSSMALELKQKRLPNSPNTAANKRPAAKKIAPISPPRAKSVAQDKNRRSGTPSKPSIKSEPLQRRRPSPVRKISSNVTMVKGPASPRLANQEEPLVPKSPTPKSKLLSESEDPATKVRELYDKIQKQQLVQMASLVEKQKREQILLQQVFEEQNTILFKQLKTIVPSSPVEVKEAWAEKTLEADRGPVSLSQLINQKSPEQSMAGSPMSTTLTDTNIYISRCDNVLKKSRDISHSINQPKSACQDSKKQSPRMQLEGSRTRTHSPVPRNTSRKLNYDTSASASSERDYEPILTDRTNDTMHDLNVTFPTDNECEPYIYNNTVFNHVCGSGKDVTVIHTHPPSASSQCSSTKLAINCMDQTIQKSINSSCRSRTKSNYFCQPTPRELAAATKIVAFAKGYLVRRLMRTERVTSTVQTIRDALLCALQLHQDREGIRGADVDLHRRLIQQITAACYTLHDTFIASSAQERCAMLSADRVRRRALAARPPALVKPTRTTDL